MKLNKIFKANEFITLKLEDNSTILYLNEERFNQCFRLLLKIPINCIRSIESVDEVFETPQINSRKTEIDSSFEFWAHCSNIQAWIENNYDTRLLHKNLAFPLLKRLTEVGDTTAKQVFKEEIAKRLLSGYNTVILYLLNEGYLKYFEKEELESLMLQIPPKNLLSFFPIISSHENMVRHLLDSVHLSILHDYESLKDLQNSVRETYNYLIKEGNDFYFKPVKALHLEHLIFQDEDISKNPLMEFTHKNSRITGISLYNTLWKNNEKIPDSLGNLENLEILDLSSCYLKTDSFPNDLNNLKSLREVYLQHNNLNSIPKAFLQLNSIKKLILKKNNIRLLNSSIGNLTQIETLNLSDNFLEFLPESIKNLVNLEIFNLENNSLKEIPEFIGHLNNLVELNISHCLKDEPNNLPKNFNQLKNLKILNVEGNFWEEDILKTISELPMLEKLTIDSKNIPYSFKDLSKLKELCIRSAASHWHTLPKPITMLYSLERLEIHYLSAKELPESINNLRNLKCLSLRHGNLETLPKTFGDITSLEGLDLWQTQPLKYLPKSFGGLEKLRTLNLSINCLSRLPKSFGKLKSLKELHLSTCRLTSLPESFGDLSSLERLWLNKNELETLPESFGNLTSLIFLTLNQNPLRSLPKSFGNLRSLKELFIVGVNNHGLKKRHKYYGPISKKKCRLVSLPKSIGNLGSLETLTIVNCNLENLPETIGKLRSLKKLELHLNKIKYLPESFGNITSLEELYLTSNILNRLPDSIGNLKNLKILDISHNKLEGIPKTIRKLESLKILDVGRNTPLQRIAIELFKDQIKEGSIYIK